VRGGTEKGWRWYREGKLCAQTDTFRDFIATTESDQVPLGRAGQKNALERCDGTNCKYFLGQCLNISYEKTGCSGARSPHYARPTRHSLAMPSRSRVAQFVE